VTGRLPASVCHWSRFLPRQHPASARPHRAGAGARYAADEDASSILICLRTVAAGASF
jgi:hypothetical protein